MSSVGTSDITAHYQHVLLTPHITLNTARGATNTGEYKTTVSERRSTLEGVMSLVVYSSSPPFKPFMFKYFPVTLEREEQEGWVIFTWVL